MFSGVRKQHWLFIACWYSINSFHYTVLGVCKGVLLFVLVLICHFSSKRITRVDSNHLIVAIHFVRTIEIRQYINIFSFQSLIWRGSG